MKRHTYPTLDQIQTMPRTELIETFKAARIGCIPKNASQNFLRGNLAWAAEAATLGLELVQTSTGLEIALVWFQEKQFQLSGHSKK